MTGELTVLNGPLRGAAFPLPSQGMLLLGQCLYNTIQLPDRAVDSYHCVFVRGTDVDPDQYLLIDLHTRAGTKVNDVGVTKSELCAGSIIAIGETRFRFDILEGDQHGPRPLPADSALAFLDAQKRQRQRALAASVGAATVRARLRPLRGVTTLEERILDPAVPLFFGRNRGAGVVLADPGCSRHQCLVAYDVNTGQFILCDLRTTNGTLLNGERIGLSALRDRDAIQLGTATEFVFLDEPAQRESEAVDEPQDLGRATLIVPRGRKPEPSKPAGGHRRSVRPEPCIVEDDTAIRAAADPPKIEASPRAKTPVLPKRPKRPRPATDISSLPPANVSQTAGLFSEAYRTLRTNLDLTTLDGRGRCIVVTSPGPQEGKTCVVVNLGIAAANVGLNVLLLEGDLRRSQLHHVFSVDARPGLVNFLANGAPIEGHIRPTSVPNLSLLPRGFRPSNPTELLHSAALAELIDDLRESYDLILIDTPPILTVADASVLSPIVDGYLLVVRSGKTPRQAAIAAVQQVQHVHGTVLGVVLNDVSPKAQRYHYYPHREY